MVLTGNILCVCVCFIETFGINGIWLGWGQYTAIFKEIGLYQDYCDKDWNGTVTDCDRRDILFNNVYTTTTTAFALSSLVMGIVQVNRYAKSTNIDLSSNKCFQLYMYTWESYTVYDSSSTMT